MSVHTTLTTSLDTHDGLVVEALSGNAMSMHHLENRAGFLPPYLDGLKNSRVRTAGRD